MKKSVQLIALVAVALLSSCSGGEKDKATAEKVDEKQRVKLASVTARPVDQIQEYTATVQAEVKNNIAPSSPVRIDQIFVEVGDRVSKGQKLVQMDAANLKQAKFRLDNQEIEFKRTDELYKVGGTSKSEWDAAKMALDVQKTTYKNLLENTALLSPINGVVTARNYDNGDMYSGGNPVLVVEPPEEYPCGALDAFCPSEFFCETMYVPQEYPNSPEPPTFAGTSKILSSFTGTIQLHSSTQT